MQKLWSEKAWEDYTYWQTQDKKTLKRINKLIKEIERAAQDSSSPMGKAERLKYSKAGLCSVRIDQTNRLVYLIESKDVLAIISCRGHYR